MSATASSGRLGPENHRAAWERLDGGELDVLVIGGGVTGAGAALDAASRGLTTALVEARDIASGTSSRSSKLFHGGLRYLEQFDVSLVREALRERDLMLTRIAPHLVRPVPFLYPLRHRGWERLYLGAGLFLYDSLGGRRSVPRHRHLSRRAVRAMSPSLAPDACVGGVRYYDAQTDDARHTLTLARTAAAHGAIVRSSTEVVALLHEDGRVVGARLRDADTGATCEVRAGVVLGCTGVWTDAVRAMGGGAGKMEVRASKGVHLVVDKDRLDLGTGIITKTEKSVLFIIPWNDRWVIGTTDTDWDLDRAHPSTSGADVDYLLERANALLATPLTRDDVVGAFAGLRPLVSRAAAETAKLSREHRVDASTPGLVAIAGGKYTTYRVMARDVVDTGAAQLGRSVPASETERIPLLGAEGYQPMLRDVASFARDLGVSQDRLRRLLTRYGSLAPEVLAPAASDPSLLEAVAGAPDYLRAEIRYAVTHEAARHLDDLLTRRTHISIETRHRGLESMADVASIAGGLLGWDDETVRAEIEAYQSRVESELLAQSAPDDASANAARLLAPEVRHLGGVPS